MRQWHGDLFYTSQARAARSTRLQALNRASALKKGLQDQDQVLLVDGLQELDDHEELGLDDHLRPWCQPPLSPCHEDLELPFHAPLPPLRSLCCL